MASGSDIISTGLLAKHKTAYAFASTGIDAVKSIVSSITDVPLIENISLEDFGRSVCPTDSELEFKSGHPESFMTLNMLIEHINRLNVFKKIITEVHSLRKRVLENKKSGYILPIADAIIVVFLFGLPKRGPRSSKKEEENADDNGLSCDDAVSGNDAPTDDDVEICEKCKQPKTDGHKVCGVKNSRKRKAATEGTGIYPIAAGSPHLTSAKPKRVRRQSAKSASKDTPPVAVISTGSPPVAVISTGLPPVAVISTGSPPVAVISTGSPPVAVISTGSPPVAVISTGSPPVEMVTPFVIALGYHVDFRAFVNTLCNHNFDYAVLESELCANPLWIALSDVFLNVFKPVPQWFLFELSKIKLNADIHFLDFCAQNALLRMLLFYEEAVLVERAPSGLYSQLTIEKAKVRYLSMESALKTCTKMINQEPCKETREWLLLCENQIKVCLKIMKPWQQDVYVGFAENYRSITKLKDLIIKSGLDCNDELRFDEDEFAVLRNTQGSFLAKLIAKLEEKNMHNRPSVWRYFKYLLPVLDGAKVSDDLVHFKIEFKNGRFESIEDNFFEQFLENEDKAGFIDFFPSCIERNIKWEDFIGICQTTAVAIRPQTKAQPAKPVTAVNNMNKSKGLVYKNRKPRTTAEPAVAAIKAVNPQIFWVCDGIRNAITTAELASIKQEELWKISGIAKTNPFIKAISYLVFNFKDQDMWLDICELAITEDMYLKDWIKTSKEFERAASMKWSDATEKAKYEALVTNPADGAPCGSK